MNDDRSIMALFYLLMAILPLAGLIARRPPLAQTVKMIAAWIAIFVIGVVLINVITR